MRERERWRWKVMGKVRDALFGGRGEIGILIEGSQACLCDKGRMKVKWLGWLEVVT
jgi:hypothetical protein